MKKMRKNLNGGRGISMFFPFSLLLPNDESHRAVEMKIYFFLFLGFSNVRKSPLFFKNSFHANELAFGTHKVLNYCRQKTSICSSKSCIQFFSPNLFEHMCMVVRLFCGISPAGKNIRLRSWPLEKNKKVESFHWKSRVKGRKDGQAKWKRPGRKSIIRVWTQSTVPIV